MTGILQAAAAVVIGAAAVATAAAVLWRLPRVVKAREWAADQRLMIERLVDALQGVPAIIDPDTGEKLKPALEPFGQWRASITKDITEIKYLVNGGGLSGAVTQIRTGLAELGEKVERLAADTIARHEENRQRIEEARLEAGKAAMTAARVEEQTSIRLDRIHEDVSERMEDAAIQGYLSSLIERHAASDSPPPDA